MTYLLAVIPAEFTRSETEGDEERISLGGGAQIRSLLFSRCREENIEKWVF